MQTHQPEDTAPYATLEKGELRRIVFVVGVIGYTIGVIFTLAVYLGR